MEKCDVRNFDNNFVADWIYNIRQASDLSVLSKAFENVLEGYGKVMERECALGIAAAEIVAAMAGRPAMDVPYAVDDYIERVKTVPDPALIQTAIKAVERIRTGSELQQIWDEREDGGAWREALLDLADRLAAT
jgi:hypothetical protein